MVSASFTFYDASNNELLAFSCCSWLAESIAKSPSTQVDEAGILIACKRDLHAGPQALLLSAVINFAPWSIFH